MPLEGDDVSLMHRLRQAPVHGERGLSGRSQDRHLHTAVGTQDQRPVRKRMGGDGRDHDAVHVRSEDGPPGGKGVGRRAAGCGEDDSVCTVVPYELPSHVKPQGHQALRSPAPEHHIVQGNGNRAAAATSADMSFEHHPGLDLGSTRQDLPQILSPAVGLHGGQEPHVSEVHPHNGHRLGGVALGLRSYHILELEHEIPADVWQEQMAMKQLEIEDELAERLRATLREIRGE